MKPRDGDLSEYTEIILDDMAQLAPDIARVLRKYMPRPVAGMALDTGDVSDTIRKYVATFSGHWDIGKKHEFLQQFRKAQEWVGAVNEYIKQREATE